MITRGARRGGEYARGVRGVFAVVGSPTADSLTAAHGWGQYSYDGNFFRLRVTHAGINAAEGTASAWGPAKVKAGSFDVWEGETLVRKDKAYAVLSLLNSGDGAVLARAGIEADFLPTIILE